MLGELKIPGYSAYLHPIGEDLLLGIGQDATDEGRPLGTQISLFDVSNLRSPTRLHKQHLGQGWSEAESDHHAFLYWPRTGLVVVPFELRAAGYRVGRARGVDPVGQRRARERPPIRRSLVVGASRPDRLGRRRQVEQPRDAGRAGLGRLPGARAAAAAALVAPAFRSV